MSREMYYLKKAHDIAENNFKYYISGIHYPQLMPDGTISCPKQKLAEYWGQVLQKIDLQIYKRSLQ